MQDEGEDEKLASVTESLMILPPSRAQSTRTSFSITESVSTGVYTREIQPTRVPLIMQSRDGSGERTKERLVDLLLLGRERSFDASRFSNGLFRENSDITF